MTPPTQGYTQLVVRSLARPYRVTASMVLLVCLVPLYIFIAEMIPAKRCYVPEIPFDRALPLLPVWVLIYGAFYLFLIVLPVLVVRQDALIRRTVWAYLSIWIIAYVCFIFLPTVAPRPTHLIGRGFALWGLRFLYSADPPYNCFPSLHVAHSFVSAFACYRIHRGVGLLAVASALLVSLSTLFIKQHYLSDVVAGVLLAAGASLVCLRGSGHEIVPELDRRVAPVFAVGLLTLILAITGCLWVAYEVGMITGMISAA